MAISFDKALGNQATALELRVKRSQILSNNMANAETPGFRAVDFEFGEVFDRNRTALQKIQAARADHLQTQPGGPNSLRPDEVIFRDNDLASLDGNKVSLEQERARFMENQIRLNATNMFLSKRFSSLQKALKGVNG